MPAIVVPFPVARRVALIRKTAAFMARSTRRVAESHARMQADKLAASLKRKGVAPELIESEVASYKAAIGAALWRAVLLPEPGDAT